jgi:hypothetical protein
LVIRYTDAQFHVYERFISFERASGTTGDDLFNMLVQWSKQLDLDINNIVSQCYDGASAMRGTYIGIMKSLYNLIEGSAIRHKVFEDIQKQVGLASITLKKLCDTCWTCRFESLKVVLTRYSEIVIALEEIDTADAFIMLKVVQTFYFIFHIHLISEVFLIINILSKYLQKSDLSLTQALVQVKITIDSLESLKNEE